MSERPRAAPRADTAKIGRAAGAITKAERSRFAALWAVPQENLLNHLNGWPAPRYEKRALRAYED
jgi:hypothetical protein